MKNWICDTKAHFASAFIILSLFSPTLSWAFTSEPLTSGLDVERDQLFFDGGYIYFAEFNGQDGTLVRVPETGGGKEILVTGASRISPNGHRVGVNHISFSPTHIYFSWGPTYTLGSIDEVSRLDLSRRRIIDIRGGDFEGLFGQDIIYFENFNNLKKRNIAPGSQEVVIPGKAWPRSQLESGASLYFVDYWSRSLFRYDPLDYAAPEMLIANASTTPEGWVVVSSQYAYLAHLGYVQQVPKDGGEVSIINLPDPSAMVLAADDTYLYYSLAGDQLWRSPLPGGTGELLEPNTLAYAATIKDGYIYWLDRHYGTTDSTLYRMDLNGDVSENNPPTLDPIENKTILENQLLEFTVTAYDPDGDFITLATNALPEGASFDADSGIFSWVPNSSQAGNYKVTIFATDDGQPYKSTQTDILITVGDVPTPTEQATEIVESVMTSDLPKQQESAYLANLKKVETFISEGKTAAAKNQLASFINKVEADITQGTLSEVIGDILIDAATQLIATLQARPDLKLPLGGGKHWLLTVEAGGEDYWGTVDQYHQPSGQYYSLDFDDYTQEDGPLTDVAVLASGNGRVIDNYWSSTYGNVVIVDHDLPYDGSGYTTLYAHLKNPSSLVSSQWVNQGDIIGVMGSTPSNISTGTHLHFEVRFEGENTRSTTELADIPIDGLLIEDYQVGNVDTPLYYLSSQNN